MPDVGANPCASSRGWLPQLETQEGDAGAGERLETIWGGRE
jgi:hypothetical protein